MNRREFITLLGGAAAALPSVTLAQEVGRTYRLGFLNPAPRESVAVAALFDELRLNGFIEGKNLTVIPEGFEIRNVSSGVGQGCTRYNPGRPRAAFAGSSGADAYCAARWYDRRHACGGIGDLARAAWWKHYRDQPAFTRTRWQTAGHITRGYPWRTANGRSGGLQRHKKPSSGTTGGGTTARH